MNVPRVKTHITCPNKPQDQDHEGEANVISSEEVDGAALFGLGNLSRFGDGVGLNGRFAINTSDLQN